MNILPFPIRQHQPFLSDISMKRIFVLFCVFFASCSGDDPVLVECSEQLIVPHKINGGSIFDTYLFADPAFYKTKTDLAEKTNANWVSLSPSIGITEWCGGPCRPYRFPVSAEVAKMKVIIPKMINSGLNNIMLKPITHFWMANGALLPEDFHVNTAEEWKEIEQAYTTLFYEFAKLSKEFPEIKLLSIGTELREFVKRRPLFFKTLIGKIRTDFPNLKLTYAANWDEYRMVPFWEDLDYIGINPYFSLINRKVPKVDEVEKALRPIKNDLHRLSCTYQKPVLFTEYGFRSKDRGLWKSRLGGVTKEDVDFTVQENSYSAFYNVFWEEPWVAGGFFWVWRVIETGPNNNGWSVNGKPAEKIIKDRYAGGS